MDNFDKPKVLFKKMLDFLVDDRGFSMSYIAKHTRIKESKIRNIRKGNSSGDNQMVKSLLNSYPELIEEFKIQSQKSESEIEKRINELETDNQLMKELMIKLLKERGDEELAKEIEKLKR